MEKVCVNHPESPSVGSCKACEKPVCLMCIVEVQGVSFCSEACGSAYQEVKDGLERPAADEEWNPLADAKPKAQEAPKPPAPAPKKAPPPQPEPVAAQPPRARTAHVPSGTEMHAALSSAFSEDSGKTPKVASPARNNMPLYATIAAVVLVLIGGIAFFGRCSTAPDTD